MEEELGMILGKYGYKAVHQHLMKVMMQEYKYLQQVFGKEEREIPVKKQMKRIQISTSGSLGSSETKAITIYPKGSLQTRQLEKDDSLPASSAPSLSPFPLGAPLQTSVP